MAQKKISRNRWIIIPAIAAVLLIGGWLVWNSVKYKFIRTESSDQVFEKSKGLYRMHYDQLDIDEVGGNLRVTNLRIVPDTTRFSQLIDEKKNQALLLDILIPELIVRGVKTPEAMINKRIEGRRLEINNPEIKCYYNKVVDDSTFEGRSKEIYEQLLGSLELISVDSVEVTGASLKILDFGDQSEILDVKNISLHLRDILIDSTHQSDSSRFYFAKHTLIDIGQIAFGAKNKTYDFSIDSVAFDTDNKSLSIHSFTLKPLMSESQYARFSKVQKDRINIRTSNINIKELDIAALARGELVADEMKISAIMLHLYRDLSYPHDGKNRVGTYPQQALQKVPFPVFIKELIAGPADIELKQKNPKSDDIGKLLFKESNIHAVNVTNMDSRIQEDNHVKIKARTKFLGVTQVDADFDLLLKNKGGGFALSGTASGFDGRGLNDVLEPLGLAKIESAKIRQLRFDLQFTDYQGRGTVVLLYDDLKVTMLKKDSIEQKLEKKKLASFISNIVLKNANPDKKDDVRVAHPVYQRDTKRSFWNLIWFTIFTGVKETVGMK